MPPSAPPVLRRTSSTCAFRNIAGYFGLAAQNATTLLWQQIGDATTSISMSPALAREMAITGAIAATLCLALFVIQVTTAAHPRPSGRTGRAFTGLLISFVGSALALATTRVLLGAVDALSDGVVRFTMDSQVGALGGKLSFVGLAQMQKPSGRHPARRRHHRRGPSSSGRP